MTFATRPANAADLPAVLKLYAELHPADPTLTDDVRAAVWEQIERQPGRTILVAEAGAAIAGTANCAVSANLTRAGRPFMLVENVVVGAA